MLKEWKVVENRKEWENILDMFTRKGFHFEYDYFELYKSERVFPKMIYAETEKAKLAYPFLLEDLSSHSNFKELLDPKKFFDVTSPYGYTGPVVESETEEDKTQLVKLFYENFADFCSENRVVSEFITFSPILENHRDLEGFINVEFGKKVVSTNLQDYGDPIYGELKKRKRKDANKCRRMGLEAEIVRNPKLLEKQIEIYYDTMDRNGAGDFYYFSKEYFEKLVDNLSDKLLLINIMLEDKLIGFDLSFLGYGVMHSFIGGSLKGRINCSPLDLASYEAIKWGHENGYKYYHTGGGLSSSPEDTLYLYKKAFAKNTDHELYLGKKIWNKEAYICLSKLAKVEPDLHPEFFPAYKRIKKE